MRFQVPITQLSRFVLALALAALSSGINLSLVQAQGQSTATLDQFDRLTATSGWILLDQKLFWTSDAGGTWEDIGPSLPSEALVQDVKFIDNGLGWVLWTTAGSEGGAEFQLSRTIDNGTTWGTQSLSLFEPSDLASNAEKAEMNWFDAETGWISVKQNTGSNFSIGVLFTTSDGGATWSRSELPVADKVYFRDPQMGWGVGGPTGDELFESRNAGLSWERIEPAHGSGQTVLYPPFSSAEQSVLMTTSLGEANSLNVYTLKDASDHWLPAGQVTLDVQPGGIGLSILDIQNFVATIPGTRSIVQMRNGELNVLENQDGHSASIVELDMVSLEVGWAKAVELELCHKRFAGRGDCLRFLFLDHPFVTNY